MDVQLCASLCAFFMHVFVRECSQVSIIQTEAQNLLMPAAHTQDQDVIKWMINKNAFSNHDMRLSQVTSLLSNLGMKCFPYFTL
jgi:hypothetical protein